jgi:hypothetical protein
MNGMLFLFIMAIAEVKELWSNIVGKSYSDFA